MKYRAEIDGLRAIAVIPVIFFHADFSYFSGGFVGVDVFFVISGYLITSIIYQEMLQERFSIMRFYERRARRILPALFVVAVACVPFAWLWMIPSEFRDFSRSLVGAGTFSSNIVFWRESGYFADAAELKPLLHTWTLAVEEQFYILYPPLLLAIYYISPKRLFFLTTLGVVASLGLAHWASVAHPEANFYLLPSRAWELGVGALLAFYLHREPILGARVTREAVGLLGLGLIIYAVLTFDESTPFPSLWTLLPVVGTALIILSADSDTLVGRLLNLRILVGIGLLSYSAYLWHQPLFAFARIRLLDGVSIEVYWLLIALTYLLALLTWKTIEVPARKRKLTPRSKILSGAIAGCLVVSAIGLFGLTNQGITANNTIVSEISAHRESVSPRRDECHATPSNKIDPSKACVMGSSDDMTHRTEVGVYVWGDSHGVELAYSLGSEFDYKSRSVLQITTSQCIATPGVNSHRESHCIDANEKAMEFLTDQAKPGIVVLVSRWPLYLVGERVSHANGCVEGTDFTGRWVDSFGLTSDRKEVLGREIKRTIERLTGAGHKVLFLHAVPEPGCHVPNRLARMVMFSAETELTYPIDTHLARKQAVQDLVKIEENDNVSILDPTKSFCDMSKEYCYVSGQAGVLYFDSNHPSLYASGQIAKRIREHLRALNW